ncbi:hypothetical protein [Streptomyces sp. RPT161]|uniref:hypothetical protein n=1 Tax=Streptomyces sp. RPT161 TaxID=3015993 RepID=UPI003FCE5033
MSQEGTAALRMSAVERQPYRQVVQGPPAGGAGIGPGGDDNRVRNGDVPAARVAFGVIPDADLTQVVGGHMDTGLLSQL